MEKIKAVRGTKDILPNEINKWQFLENKAREIFSLYGYKEIRTPVFEEILFRGFWFEGFRDSRIKIVGAILFTSLLWTLLHVQYNVWGMTSIFILGLIIGIVRYLTNSLWCCMLIHIVVNLAAIIQTAYVVGNSST